MGDLLAKVDHRCPQQHAMSSRLPVESEAE